MKVSFPLYNPPAFLASIILTCCMQTCREQKEMLANLQSSVGDLEPLSISAEATYWGCCEDDPEKR